ncbi:MAG: cytochrome c [Actinomycetota bacterium]|nr:cytochrome c [Actinomycetota bacterium]
MESGDVLLIAAIVLVPAALLWGLFLLRTGRTGRPAVILGIPPAMRPGQPDEVLEGPRLERIQVGWIVSLLATALFIPAYWLPEKGRQEAFVDRFSEESLHRGALIFAAPPELDPDVGPAEFKEEEKALSLGQGCANCHGPAQGKPEDIASGGFASPCNVCPTDPVTGKPLVKYAAPPLNNVFTRWDPEVVRFTIERGRPGTPMPTWGVDYGGGMTDQSIDDVMAWLMSLPGNQEAPGDLAEACSFGQADDETCSSGSEIFEARCAVCHGPKGQGKEEPPEEFAGMEGQPDATWYPGMALWRGDVLHLESGVGSSAAFAGSHLSTITNGRRFAFMPAFGEAPAQGIPVPPYPLTPAQIEAVMAYERTL